MQGYRQDCLCRLVPAIHGHGMDSAYITRIVSISAMQGCDRTGCVVPVVDILIVFQCYSSVSLADI